MNKIRCMGETVDPNKQYDGRKVLALIKTSFQNGMKAGYKEGYKDAEQMRKHGHWEWTGSCQICSICGEEQYGADTGRYFCQNCGAKMDEEFDETENIKI